ncbi:aminotransferase class V-fold PLP-dependent enzyme [Clostridium pasteurianum]|uniref:aminotransferase class V-fold PLP-dependent enzyme n=1 Tax=Clostridium pasteurianum TaxID=1501 RepID=UPI002260DE9C|nr:aminotransferase class V-fold PLP-dependent enzyme [Clostridium pasteurianum]UZW15917.1 aminotransferase class V-fold PLP-dependent enzyme [Clostridium pasteurianum]
MIYLDNAATSFPKPSEVYDEVLNCMKNYAANPGRSSHDMSIKASSKIAETRQELSTLFNIDCPFNIIFTCNATESLNMAIKGLFKSGNHVISTVIEHNSVLRPLNYLNKAGVELTLLDVNREGFIDIGELEKSIKKNTKAIIVNHASNVLGTIQDIEKIGSVCKKYGLIFMLDASQSAGVVTIDVDKANIDLLAFPGHKGLLGPQGTGGLFVREGIKLNNFIDGGTGSNSSSMDQPDFLPDKFESGTLNTPGIAGLYEGIKFIKKIGIENIEKRERALTEYLLSELKKISYVELYGLNSVENRAAVVSINIDGMDSSTVGYILNKNNIAVRTGYHCAPLIHHVIGTKEYGTVRISPGYFNTEKDIEKFLDVIKSIYKQNLSI